MGVVVEDPVHSGLEPPRLDGVERLNGRRPPRSKIDPEVDEERIVAWSREEPIATGLVYRIVVL